MKAIIMKTSSGRRRGQVQKKNVNLTFCHISNKGHYKYKYFSFLAPTDTFFKTIDFQFNARSLIFFSNLNFLDFWFLHDFRGFFQANGSNHQSVDTKHHLSALHFSKPHMYLTACVSVINHIPRVFFPSSIQLLQIL